MRLTLRTLLAYLDDVLGPEQAREIGTKVDESNVAKTLMARLKEVTRKRRVLAPAIDTRDENADANAIAQYLDNTLPPERIGNVERRALESDEVLAEVASCHQILTLVLGNPTHITEQTRHKMYALVESKLPRPVAAPVPAIGQPAAAPHAPAPAPRPSIADLEAIGAGSGFYRMAESLGESIETKPGEVPQYLKKTDTRGNLLKVLAVAAVLLIWLGAVYSDPALDWFRGDETTIADRGKDVEKAAAVAPAADMAVKPAPLPRTGVNGDAPPSAAPKPSTELAMTPKVDSETPLSNPLTSTLVTTTNTVDSAPMTSVPASPSVAMTPTTSIELPNDPPRPLARYTFTTPDELLLAQVRVDGVTQWQTMATGAVLQEGQMIAVPKPFRVELIGPDPLAGLTIDGATLARLDGSDAVTSLGLTMTQGRVILTHKGTADPQGNPAPIRVSLTMQKDPWTIELLSPGTICGVEMVPRSPETFEEDYRGNGYHARVLLKSGKVRVLRGNEVVSIIENGDAVIKTWDGAGNPTLSQVVGNLLGLITDGAWIDESQDRRTQPQRSYAVKYYRAFSPGMNVLQILPVVAMDQDVRMSEYATLSLGLIRNPHELVNILANGIHGESREDAILSLRMWMNEDITNRVELKEELASYFSEGTADIIYRLLWGVSKQEAASPITSRQLIELLGHEDVAVRHLVIDQLKKLTGRDYEYRAELSTSLREKSVSRWFEHLAKEGAILPAAKEVAPSPAPTTQAPAP